jgi:propanediol dehydratase small subunit
MKRTTVYLSEEVDAELTRLAKEKSMSKAALVRQAVGTLVNTASTAATSTATLTNMPSTAATLPAWVGSVSNGHLDDVSQLEKYLGELYEADYRKTIESIERQETREHSG